MPTVQCQISETIVWRNRAYHHESSGSKLGIFTLLFLTVVCMGEGFIILLIAMPLLLQAGEDLCQRKRTTYIFLIKYVEL